MTLDTKHDTDAAYETMLTAFLLEFGTPCFAIFRCCSIGEDVLWIWQY